MKDSGSREPLHFLLFSTSLLSKPKRRSRCTSKCSGVFYVIHYFVSIFSGLSILDFHNNLQTIGKFSGFQFISINNSNSKLGGTVPGCCVAPSG